MRRTCFVTLYVTFLERSKPILSLRYEWKLMHLLSVCKICKSERLPYERWDICHCSNGSVALHNTSNL